MNPVIQVKIEKPVYGSDCLAHLPETAGKSGKAVFVPLTLPGETISAHITEDKRSFAKAELDEVLTPSPNRVPPPCPHFGSCGGCHYQHADYATQLALKQQVLRETLVRAGVGIPQEIAVLAKEPWAYRNRIRLAMTPDGRYGYRGRRSHDIVPIRECPIAAPLLLQTAERVAAFLRENPAPAPISEPALISELELFTNHDQSQLLLTLFSEKTTADESQSWLSVLREVLSHAVLGAEAAGIRLQLADSALSPTILAASGPQSLTYSAAGFDYQVDHGAFFQVNRWLIDAFVSLGTSGHSGKIAWDLYAGVGLFARRFASSFAQVLAVESAPASFPALQRNLGGATARAINSTTLDFLRRNRQEREPRPDLIVLDPPRAGLGDEVTTLLNAIHAPEMVYVSCDPATLARDLRALTLERYRIESLTLVDMFPQTFHIETVVRLRRS
jgi:23S rRNA (uracil1939-C5)-methyltransferase